MITISIYHNWTGVSRTSVLLTPNLIRKFHSFYAPFHKCKFKRAVVVVVAGNFDIAFQLVRRSVYFSNVFYLKYRTVCVSSLIVLILIRFWILISPPCTKWRSRMQRDPYMIDCTYSNQSVYVLVLVVSFAICTTTTKVIESDETSWRVLCQSYFHFPKKSDFFCFREKSPS